MKKFTKSRHNNRKSFLSVALASILALSFNYSPISLISNWIKNTASAYKSSTLQEYYPNTTTTNESKFGSANYPKELEKYFSDSKNNFNIKTYYEDRFASIFADHIHAFLSNDKDGNAEYKASYMSFLETKGYKTLKEYYNSDSVYIKTTYECDSFTAFVEYFVSHEIEYTKAGIKTFTMKLFTGSNYRSQLYTALGTFINNKISDSIPGEGGNDGLPTDMKDEDFYEHSISYNNVKEAIDSEIVKTVAIYSYDGVTQNNNMAAIIAKDAPVTNKYYYSDSDFTKENIPNVSYVQKTHQGVKKVQVYYFGSPNELSKYSKYTENSNYFYVTTETKEFYDALLQYRPVQPDEFGYIDNDSNPNNGTKIVTYYKYNSVPYLTANDKYQVYVYDNDGVTASEQATYDSLFMNVITQADIDADEANAKQLNKTSYKDANLYDLNFYYKVPYNTGSQGDMYYKLLTNNYADTTFQRYCSTFANRLYLKLKTNENYVVYIDKNENSTLEGGESVKVDAKKFMSLNSTYTYKVVDIDLQNGVDQYNNEISTEDFFEITASYSAYYRSNYKLYFKKIKKFYEELVTDDSVYEKDGENYVYETELSPYIPFEMAVGVPLSTYETDSNGKIIYALSESTENVEIGTNSFKPVSQATLDDAKNRNVYIEVPKAVYTKVYGTAEQTTKLYYKHKLSTIADNIKQIYVLDDTKNAANNEVYKNLNYKVITSAEYKKDSNFKNFIAIQKTDANYNSEFKLYYRYNLAMDDSDLYVQNALRNSNAIYIIDDSLTYSDRTAYSLNLYTVISTSEFNAESEFYTQITENDSNYSTLYTKLYYKYNAISGEENNVVYLYTTSTSDKYATFSSADSNYVAQDYKLITPSDADYVEGLELYYKKVRKETYKKYDQTTTYYYKTTSDVTLAANNYYALSFYVNTTGANTQASLYLTDKNGIIEDIKFEHISTEGKWVKYVAFLATDTLSASSVALSIYLGDRESIAGNTSETSITGAVLFDDLKITTINRTDFAKGAIDDKVVETTETNKTGEGTAEHSETIKVVIANTDNNLKDTNTYDYRTNKTAEVINVEKAGTWDNMFNFDNADLAEKFENLADTVDENTDGYSSYNEYWQYYIGRNVSGQGNNYVLTQYQEAYKNNNLIASIVEESSIDKTIKEDDEDKDEDKDDEKDDDKKEEDKKEEDKKEDKKDVPYISSTFRANNKVLKLENKNRLISLGVASNYFTISQFQYYKITVWIYSPDKDSTATLTLNSILNTSSTPAHGSLQTKAITAKACMQAYTTTPANEYSWIPVSFFIEGNTLHDQTVSLVLAADANSTVYFDNIIIENISSAAYDTASSDSDDKTQVLSLVPNTSVVTNGITNGYFNNITLKENYKYPNFDFSAPKAAKSWTVNANNSSNVIAGIVPTSKTYTSLEHNFFKDYNNSNIPYAEGYTADGADDTKPSYGNIYGIYASPTRNSSIADAYEKNVATTNTYKIYSSSINLSASSVYEVSFDFQPGYLFDGEVVANIYYGSVDSAKIISTMTIDSDTITNKDIWTTYTFYIATSTTSATIYLEFGVQKATGTCFFKDAASVTTTKTLEAIRDELIDDAENVAGSNTDLYEKVSFANVQFVDFATLSSTIHSPVKDANSNTYQDKEYTVPVTVTDDYTLGQKGVAVASYYAESEVITTYSVTISKVVYYIGAKEVDGETVYNLYKFKDCCDEDIVTEIDGMPVTVESFKKVTVGEADDATDYTSTSTEKTEYLYTFENDVTLNNVVIPASELTNKQSSNVLILANSYGTDYTIIEPAYTSTLNKTSYLVLKIYVKTSDFENADFGLNINVNSISTKWTNVNTTTVESTNVDEYGFVCYQALIKTGDNSITSFGVKFSLGDERHTGTGYAIISDIVLESFSTEEELDHYAEKFDEDETTIKKYFANSKKATDSTDEETEDEGSVTWATFFYIFSSLLLVLVLAIALVAAYMKKHPIKKSVKAKNEHEKDLELIDTTPSKKLDAKKVKEIKQEDDGSEGIV